MTKFDKVKFVKALKTLPFPVAHTVFLEPQTAPYLIYLDDEYDVIAADSKSVFCKTIIVLELYTKGNQTDEFENIVEIFLDDFTTFEKSKSYIKEEQVYITYYKFEL